MKTISHLLDAIEQGDPQAADQLMPLVYTELRQLAMQRLARESPGQTLQPTALVHEAYLRLVDVEKAQHWNSRGHFFAAAAEAMRRILVENARRKRGPKQGGDQQRVVAELDNLIAPSSPVDVLVLDEALTRLAEQSPVRAELVKLRFFAGMTMLEAAQALGISLATAERYWTYARAWLFAELSDAEVEAQVKELENP